MWCWQFIIGIWICIVRCWPLRNPFHCFFNWCAKHSRIFVQCQWKCLSWNVLQRRLIFNHLDSLVDGMTRTRCMDNFLMFFNSRKKVMPRLVMIPIYPIPIFDISFPFPVSKSQSKWFKSHYRPIPIPVLPLQDPHPSSSYQDSMRVAFVKIVVYVAQTIWIPFDSFV